MSRKNKTGPVKFQANERGQALILVLVFLVLGSLVLAPLLSYLGTVFQSGGLYRDKTDRFYAADSGIEDAIWQIKYNNLKTRITDYDPYDFNTTWTYNLDEPVNEQDVTVGVQNIWMPTVTLAQLGLSPAEAKDIIERDIKDTTINRLIVTGTNLAEGAYRINLDFYPAEDLEDPLEVASVGIWLPLGFTYNGNCNLEGYEPLEDYYQDPTVSVHDGGQVVVWEFGSAPFISFPGVNPADVPMSAEITFEYTLSQPETRPAAVSWILTSGALSYDIPISWDADIKIYRVTSESGETTIESYASKCELRKIGSAISGDYRAVGNSLMTDSYPDWWEIRDELLDESSANVSNIPPDAEVVAAYLYWSGWFDGGIPQPIWQDDCDDFDNWDRDSGSANQTKVPTADGDRSGTWNYSPRWDDVDETTPNDNDYMTGTTNGGGYQLFSFPTFSIPAGATITDLTVYVRARDASSGDPNNIHPYIKVDWHYYNNATSHDPGTDFMTYSYSYTTNPDTGDAWVAEDLNGTGSHPLQQFGVYSTDLNPDVQVSMVYAQVNYVCESSWSLDSGHFKGHSGCGPYLTMKNSLDLSSYPSGSVTVSWDQWEYGNLEGSDALRFQFYDGSSWSSSYTAFAGNIGSTPQNESCTVPDAYLTSNFKFRFKLENFGGDDEYCYVDNFAISELVQAADTSVVFEINGYQVYLDEQGNPQKGDEEIDASDWSTLANQPGQYSYACHRNVTKLVQAYSNVGNNENHTGNGNYTVGGADADTGEHWSYAGWSLIIVYSSAETAGHQLYLYDNFAWAHEYQNLDFDGDGQPGGSITGFIVPEPIEGEVNAATLTCFVAEGDGWISGDQLLFNDTALSDDYDVNNVWNSESIGMTEDGMDIDTFYVTWLSGLLEPGETSAQLDLPTDMDNWNLIYIILSFRSKTVTRGTSHYVVHGS